MMNLYKIEADPGMGRMTLSLPEKGQELALSNVATTIHLVADSFADVLARITEGQQSILSIELVQSGGLFDARDLYR